MAAARDVFLWRRSGEVELHLDVSVSTLVARSGGALDVKWKDSVRAWGGGRVTLASEVAPRACAAAARGAESARFRVPLLKSNLQKAVRRHARQAALGTALQLLRQDPAALLRRLPIIAVEDAFWHPWAPAVVWLMMAHSRGFVDGGLHAQAAAVVLGVVGDLATASSSTAYEVVRAGGEGAREDDKPGALRRGCVAQLAAAGASPSTVANVGAFALRVGYGGMGGDMGMMARCCRLWSARLAPRSTWAHDQWTRWTKAAATRAAHLAALCDATEPAAMPSWAPLERFDGRPPWVLSVAADQHCCNIVRRIADANLLPPGVPEAALKAAIWDFRSGVNARHRPEHRARRPAPAWWPRVDAFIERSHQLFWRPLCPGDDGGATPAPKRTRVDGAASLMGFFKEAAADPSVATGKCSTKPSVKAEAPDVGPAAAGAGGGASSAAADAVDYAAVGRKRRADFFAGIRGEGDDGTSLVLARELALHSLATVPKAYYPSRSVTPHVCLAAEPDAGDWEFVRGDGTDAQPHFRLIVNVAGPSVAGNYFDAHPTVRYVCGSGAGDAPLAVDELSSMVNAIEGGIGAGLNVLVHGLEGRARSAAVVIAWMGRHRGVAYDDAVRSMRIQRKFIGGAPGDNARVSPTDQQAACVRQFVGKRAGGRNARAQGAGTGSVRVAAGAAKRGQRGLASMWAKAVDHAS